MSETCLHNHRKRKNEKSKKKKASSSSSDSEAEARRARKKKKDSESSDVSEEERGRKKKKGNEPTRSVAVKSKSTSSLSSEPEETYSKKTKKIRGTPSLSPSPARREQVTEPADLNEYVCYNAIKKKYVCKVCDKFCYSSRYNVRNHVEAVHFSNYFKYPCGLCDKIVGSKNVLSIHMSRMHKAKK